MLTWISQDFFTNNLLCNPNLLLIMSNLTKSFSLLIILVLAASIVIIVKPSSAQTATSMPSNIPIPVRPEFTLQLIGPPFVENTTYSLDPNTGQIVANIGYTNPFSIVEIIIKNQPFTPFNDNQGNPISMFYNVQVAVHNQTDSWISLYDPILATLHQALLILITPIYHCG